VLNERERESVCVCVRVRVCWRVLVSRRDGVEYIIGGYQHRR